MNIKKSITSLVIITIIFGLLIPYQKTIAQEEIQRPTMPEKSCKELKPDFTIMYTDLILAISDGKIEIDTVTYNNYNLVAFDAAIKHAQNSYHKYAECIFNYTEAKILGSVGASKGTMQATTPNFDPSDIPIIGPGIDWMTSAACLNPQDLQKIIEDTSPNEILAPILETYNAYSDYLDKILNIYSLRGQEDLTDNQLSLSAIEEFSRKTQVIQGGLRRINTEKENAIVAMNITFASLKELRLAFIMHVHFQCILNSLDKYRKSLEKIRTIVDLLPSRLQDASMLCS